MGRFARAAREWPLLAAFVTAAAFAWRGERWLAELANVGWFAFMLAWLFAIILLCAFAVVRHAEALAARVGEPYGTLVLTVSMSGMEMMMIAAVMYAGGGSALGRDTMFAILMIVLNGLVGTCLLAGGLRYHEQSYNLYGANAFLALIVPLSVLGLVLPTFTLTSPGPAASPLHAAFLVVMSIALYGIVLGVQTTRHREYFIHPEPDDALEHTHDGGSLRSHAALLILYALPIVYLSKQIAVPIGYATEKLDAPAALGGLLVAILILSPESLAAVRAALANRLQRSINVALGTALSSISLTIPAVLTIGYLAERTIILGLEPASMVLLVLTFAVSMLTFALERTNVLLGAVHLLLFLAYLMLLFEP
jgi:Ca2+:H+ antiporter